MKLFSKTLFLVILVSFLKAESVFAQSFGGVSDYKGFVAVLLQIFRGAVSVLIGFAFLIVVWGIFLYITKADDPEMRREGMRYVAYGILGIFIMVSFWGIVNLLVGTFRLQGGATVPYRRGSPSDLPGNPVLSPPDSSPNTCTGAPGDLPGLNCQTEVLIS